jgi:hypothetical protein
MSKRAARIATRLQDACIEVREHLVLVGPNDVGKSSVLRCLDLLLGATTAQLYGRLTAADLRNPDEPLVVSAVFADLDDEDRAWFPDEISIDPATQAASLEVRLEARIEDGETLDIRRFMPGGGGRRQVSRDQLARLGWRLIGAVSSVRDLRDDRNATLDDILRSIDLGPERAELTAITEQVRDKLTGSPKLGDLRGLLATQLSRALPETVEQDDLSFVPGAAATDDVFSDVRLQVLRHGTIRNLSEQSDGTRAMFAVALYDSETRTSLTDALGWTYDLLREGVGLDTIRGRVRTGTETTLLTAAGAHLLSGHVGKGQQFDWVLVLGAEDGCIPDFRAESPSQHAEEARILGVMMSRARHGIVVLHAAVVEASNGRPWRKDPSPFLRQLQKARAPPDDGGRPRVAGRCRLAPATGSTSRPQQTFSATSTRPTANRSAQQPATSGRVRPRSSPSSRRPSATGCCPRRHRVPDPGGSKRRAWPRSASNTTCSTTTPPPAS